MSIPLPFQFSVSRSDEGLTRRRVEQDKRLLVFTYTGGGANIGLSLLASAMPGYLPVIMIRLVVGEACNAPQKRT